MPAAERAPVPAPVRSRRQTRGGQVGDQGRRVKHIQRASAQLCNASRSRAQRRRQMPAGKASSTSCSSAGWRSRIAVRMRARSSVTASLVGMRPGRRAMARRFCPLVRGRSRRAERSPGDARRKTVEQRAAVFGCQRLVGMRARCRLQPGAKARRAAPASRSAGLAQQIEQRLGQRARARPAPPGTPPAPSRRTSVSGSSPAGSVARRSVRSGASSGSASSAARAAARAPAASPSKHSTGAGDRRHSSLQLLLGQRGAERRHRAARTRPDAARSRPCSPRPPPPRRRRAPPRAPDPARRACAAWRTASVSGPFRYFGWPSPRMRPPKLMTRPRRSRIGNITRLKNSSRAPAARRSASRSSPASISMVRRDALARQFRGQRAAALAGPAEAEARIVVVGQPAPAQIVQRRARPPAGTAGAGSWRCRRVQHADAGHAAAAPPRPPPASASAPPARPRRPAAPPPP